MNEKEPDYTTMVLKRAIEGGYSTGRTTTSRRAWRNRRDVPISVPFKEEPMPPTEKQALERLNRELIRGEHKWTGRLVKALDNYIEAPDAEVSSTQLPEPKSEPLPKS